MIFVTTGTGHYSFDRLIHEMDQIAASIDEAVVMQVGNTRYEPQNAEFFNHCPSDRLEEYISDSRIVVSHCGVGTIILLLKKAKPFILVPRLRKYGENINDHQVEIAKQLGNEGITVVNDVSNLKDLLRKEKMGRSPTVFDGGSTLTLALKKYLRNMETQMELHQFNRGS